MLLQPYSHKRANGHYVNLRSVMYAIGCGTGADRMTYYSRNPQDNSLNVIISLDRWGEALFNNKHISESLFHNQKKTHPALDTLKHGAIINVANLPQSPGYISKLFKNKDLTDKEKTKHLLTIPVFNDDDSIRGVIVLARTIDRGPYMEDMPFDALEINTAQLIIKHAGHFLRENRPPSHKATIYDPESYLEGLLELMEKQFHNRGLSHVLDHIDDVTRIMKAFMNVVNDEKSFPFTFLEIPESSQKRITLLTKLHDWCKIHTPREILEFYDKFDILDETKGVPKGTAAKIMEWHVFGAMHLIGLPGQKREGRIIAGHHQNKDGSGYKSITCFTPENMPLESSMIRLCDVFAALARKRSYKKAFPVEHSLLIMLDMALQDKLEPNLFRLFVERRVYEAFYERGSIYEAPIPQNKIRTLLGGREIPGLANSHLTCNDIAAFISKQEKFRRPPLQGSISYIQHTYHNCRSPSPHI